MLLRLIMLALTLGVLHNALGQSFPFSKNIQQGAALNRSFYDVKQQDDVSLLFAVENGIFKHNSEYLSSYIDFKSYTFGAINDIKFIKGGIWIASENGIFFLDEVSKEANLISTELVDKIRFNAEADRILFISPSKILSLKNDELTENIDFDGCTDIAYFNKSYYLASETGLSIYSQIKADITPIQLLQNKKITALHKSKSYVLAATENELYKILPNNTIAFLTRFDDIEITTIHEDETSSIWIGTKNDYLFLFDGLDTFHFTKNEDFDLASIAALRVTNDNNMWFLGKPGATYLSASKPFSKLEIDKNLKGTKILDLHQLSDHDVLIFTAPDIISTISYGAVSNVQRIPLPFEPKFFRFIDQDNYFIVSNDGTIWLKNRGSIKSFKLNKITHFVEKVNDKSVIGNYMGDVWVLHHDQMIIEKYEIGEFSKLMALNDENLVFQSADKSLKFLDTKTKKIKPFQELTGKLNSWASDSTYGIIAGIEKGLQIYRAGKFINLSHSQTDQLQFDNLQLSNNQLWAGTNDNRLLKIELISIDEKVSIQNVKVYGDFEGINNAGIQRIVNKKPENVILATERQLYIYDYYKDFANISTPGIQLNEVLILGRDSTYRLSQHELQLLDAPIRLKHNEEFKISAIPISFSSNQSTFWQYELDGTQLGQQYAKGESVYLRNLSPGQHSIKVYAVNAQGFRSEEIIEFSVLIAQPYWLKPWFLGSITLGLLLFGFVTYKTMSTVRDGKAKEMKEMLDRELQKLERQSHQQMLKAEKLKQLNDLITSQKDELEQKNRQIEGQKYELALTNEQIKKQKDLILETGNKLQSSINYAQRIQTALMADEISIKQSLEESFVFFKPRDYVSGDFFWFASVMNEDGEEEFIIAAVDCTGHGVPGAIVSVIGIQLLNVIVKHKGIYDPGEILTELHKDVKTSLHHEKTDINDGMDMTLCRINLKQRSLWYAGAKNPLYYVVGNEMEKIRGDKYPIGGQQREIDRIFTTHHIDLPKDGKRMFYIFTDGYQDQFGGDEQFKFLSKNFREMLLEIADLNMVEQKYELEKRLVEWKGEVSQTDDILVMGFRI